MGKCASDSRTAHVHIIRCGTPDCDWGKKVLELSEEQMDLCHAEFRAHCIQTHGLEEWDVDAKMYLDLVHWTMTLIKI